MSPGSTFGRPRTLWTMLGPVGRVAAVVAALAIVVVLLSLRTLVVAAVTASAPSGSEVAQDQKQQAERFAKNFDGYMAQINGRSLFFIPAAPTRPETPSHVADSGTPRPPTRYGGPAVIGFANDAVYFADGRHLRAGDDSDSTLKVTKLDAPWGASVVWEGAEFNVSLFDRDRLVLPTSATLPEEPKPADPPKQDEGGAAPAPSPAGSGAGPAAPRPEGEPSPAPTPSTTPTPAPATSPAPATDTPVPKGTDGDPA